MSEDVNNSFTFGFAYPTNLVVLPGFAARFMYSIISLGINNHEWDSSFITNHIAKVYCSLVSILNYRKLDSFSLFDADLSAKLVTDIVEVLNIMQIQPRYGSCEVP